MKKRLYLKFIGVYVCFLVFSFLSVNFLGGRLIENHTVKTRTEAMYKEANVIAAGRLAQTYANSNSSKQDIYTNLLALSSFQNMEVWLINKQGEIIVNTSQEFSEDYNIPLNNFSTAALAGNYYQRGRFFGYFDKEMLSVVAPITSNYQTNGYIAIHYDVSQMRSDSNAMLNIMYISMAGILLLSLLLILCFHKLVFRPLGRLIRGADEYAAGNLNYKMPLETHDEMGYLAASMTYMAGEINKAGEYQRKFVSNISHDFRSPLTSIKGYVEAIQDGTIPPEMQQKYLDIVLTETERLNKLTQGLLTLNNFDDKGTYLDLSNFDINAVIRSTAATFEGICTERSIHIQLIFEDAAMTVTADMGKIQQVLYNLLDNAIKFSHQSSTIYIQTSEKHEKVFVSVKDTGEGISKDSITKIWDRFYKSDPSRGRDKKGTGLGLAITKEIIQAHNENINVVSTLGVGTEFTFTLPKAREE